MLILIITIELYQTMPSSTYMVSFVIEQKYLIWNIVWNLNREWISENRLWRASIQLKTINLYFRAPCVYVQTNINEFQSSSLIRLILHCHEAPIFINVNEIDNVRLTNLGSLIRFQFIGSMKQIERLMSKHNGNLFGFIERKTKIC